MIVDFARIQDYEERREGACAGDELNVRANTPSPLLSEVVYKKGGRIFGSLKNGTPLRRVGLLRYGGIVMTPVI